MAEAKIRITAQDDASAVLNKVGGGLGALNAATLGVSLSIGGLIAGIAASVKAFNEQDAANRKLAIALKNTGSFSEEAVESFDTLATAMQKSTNFSDDATITAAAQLKTFTGLSNEMVQRLIPAVADFATAQGIDLADAATQMAKSIAGGRDVLKSFGIEVAEANDETGRAENTLKVLQERFGGLAEGEGKSFAGQLNNVTDGFGELLEAIGKFIAESPFVQATIGALVATMEVLVKIMGGGQKELVKFRESLDEAAKASQKSKGALDGYQATIEKTTFKLGDVNTLTEKEIKLFKELAKTTEEDEKNLKAFGLTTKQVLEKTPEQLEEIGAARIKAIEAGLKADEVAFEQEKKNHEERIRLAEFRADFEIAQEERVEADKKLAGEQGSLIQTEIFEKFKFNEEEKLAFLTTTTEQERLLIQQGAENRLAVMQQISDATKAIFNALSTSISNAFVRAFDSSISGANKAKAFFADFGKAVLGIISQLIAKMIIFAALSAILGPGGTFLGLGATALAGFQTPMASSRIVPGPANAAIPIIAHGGERIGRGGDGGITVNFSGISTDPSATAQTIIQLIRDEQKRTGFSLG